MNIKRETISLKINPDLWKEARKRAIDEGVSYSEYVEKLIQDNLSKSPSKKVNNQEKNKSSVWVTM